MSKATLIEWVKDAPTISVAGLALAGVSLQDWVLILSAIYGVWRVCASIVEFYWKWKDRNASK